MANNAALATITLDAEITDSDGFHSLVSNTDRLTVPANMGGQYYVFFSGMVEGAVDVLRGMVAVQINIYNASNVLQTSRIKYNGTVTYYSTTNSAGGADCELVYSLAAGDYAQFQIQQQNNNSVSIPLKSNADSKLFQAGLYKLRN